jgi:hypothetical protein
METAEPLTVEKLLRHTVDCGVPKETAASWVVISL